MIGADDQVLYVGKAKNLKNRVSSYFRGRQQSPKTVALVEKIERIEVTVTNSETEALLLEQTLIKSLKPPFNILLRDDKSYPYIYLSQQDFPRLAYYRGSKKLPGRFFGPYPSAAAVRETLNLLQKIFNVRQCEDSFYRNRSRPCLQHQIERCKAPCVGLVSEEEYAEDVRHTIMFLEGKSSEVRKELTASMEAAAAELQFERAAQFRDQLEALTHVQSQQFVETEAGNADVFAVAVRSAMACVQVVYVRGGRVMGNKTYYPVLKADQSTAEILDEFVPQYYLGGQGGRDMPQVIIVAEPFESQDALVEALQQQYQVSLSVSSNVRTARRGWLRLAQTNAEQYLSSHLANRENLYKRFEALRDALSLDEIPQRLECFDISHTQGEQTVASCVVFEHNGPVRNQYRRFNIEGVTAGDDYAAMEQAVMRRYKRLEKGEGVYPDLILVDGGKGQVTAVIRILEKLSMDLLKVVGVAKGEGRRAGLETLIEGRTFRKWSLKSDDPALHLIQQIRDEAHRFAIAGHRAKRDKARNVSKLDGISGIGPKRKRDLLRHFGSYAGVESANVEELEKVSGINAAIATRIYEYCNNA